MVVLVIVPWKYYATQYSGWGMCVYVCTCRVEESAETRVDAREICDATINMHGSIIDGLS